MTWKGWNMVVFYGDFMGFHPDFIGFYGDFMGFHPDFIGFYGDFMGFIQIS